MQCPKCQFENRDDAKFCGECGHKFQISCPEYGTDNRIGNKFCDECGSNLNQAGEASDHISKTKILILIVDFAHFFMQKAICKQAIQYLYPDIVELVIQGL